MNENLTADELKTDLLGMAQVIQDLAVRMAPYTALEMVGGDIHEAFNKLMEAKFWLVHTASLITPEVKNGHLPKVSDKKSK